MTVTWLSLAAIRCLVLVFVSAVAWYQRRVHLWQEVISTSQPNRKFRVFALPIHGGGYVGEDAEPEPNKLFWEHPDATLLKVLKSNSINFILGTVEPNSNRKWCTAELVYYTGNSTVLRWTIQSKSSADYIQCIVISRNSLLVPNLLLYVIVIVKRSEGRR